METHSLQQAQQALYCLSHLHFIFKMKKYLMLSFILIASMTVHACQCYYFTLNFIESVDSAYEQYGNDFYIVKAKVASYETYDGYAGKKLEVIENIFNNTSNDTINLVGANGVTCYANPNYAVGDTILIILVACPTGLIPANSPVDNYCMSLCGHFSVKITNNMVYGGDPSSFTYNGYPLSNFMDSLALTFNLLTDIDDHDKISSLKNLAYPNPANDFLYINLQSKIHEISIYSLSGTLIKKEKYKNGIDISTLIKGLYLLLINTDMGIVSTKFLKE
jgi:hypothetical protein